MSTVILSSAGFKTPKLQEELLKILPKKPSELRLVFINTASNPDRQKDYLDRDRKVLIGLGFVIEDLDIEGKDYQTLEGILSDKDIVFVEGGNTFYLLKRMRESGFDRLIKELIDQGVIYIGVSAGSYVACPTIEMGNWKANDRERFGVVDLTALNLVPFLLTAHYNREKYREGIREGVLASKLPVKILTDDQALLIQDGKDQLIGEGDEVIIK